MRNHECWETTLQDVTKRAKQIVSLIIGKQLETLKLERKNIRTSARSTEERSRTLRSKRLQFLVSAEKWKPKAKQGVPETVKDGKGTKEEERNEQTIRGIKDNKKRQAEPARHRERQTGRGPGEAGKAHVKT